MLLEKTNGIIVKAGALFGMGTLVVIPGDEFNVPVLDGNELLGTNVLSVVTNGGVDVRPQLGVSILIDVDYLVVDSGVKVT